MTQSDGWSRRGILTARGLGASTGGAIAALLPPPELRPEDDRRVNHWVVTRRAMACEFVVRLHPRVHEPLAKAESAFAEIDRFEDLLSAYRGTSDICRVNQQAFEHPVRVEACVFELLQRCAELHAQTGGAFDIAAGLLVKAWGFFDRSPRRPEPAELVQVMQCCGMQHVELDAEAMTVRFRTPGVELNLGSIGKGYAIDRAMRRLQQECGIDCGMVTGGTSSMAAVGSLWGDDEGWLIGIEDPADTSRLVATVRLKDRALGTSSTSEQYFELDGKRYGHLLDPRSGQPADQVASVSVLAPDAATADALATAFFVAGLDKTAEFCHNHPDIAAILVLKDRPGSTGNLPALRHRWTARKDARVVAFNLTPQELTVHRRAT